MKSKWIWAILLVFLVVLSPPAVMAGRQLKAVNVISMPQSNQLQPSVFGNTLVFVDDDGPDPNIVVYDLRSGEGKGIASRPNSPRNPYIHESMVVWDDLTVTDRDIILYDMAINHEFQITHHYGNQTHPFILGDYIAWQDDRDGNWDIFLYDMETEDELQVTSSSADQVSPVMCRYKNDIVLVWIEKGSDGGASDIFEYRFSSLEVSPVNISKIASDSQGKAHVAASGTDVVFSSDNSGSYDIYLNEWGNGSLLQITSDEFDQRFPAMDGDNIIWIDGRTGSDEIYQLDVFFQDEEVQLTDTRNPKSNVQISENWVVWVEERGDDKDIYYLDLNMDVRETRESFNPQYIIGLFLIFGAVYLLVLTFKQPRSERLPTAAEIKNLNSRDELTRMCGRLGLSTKGNNERLRKRLMGFIEEQPQMGESEPVWGKFMSKRHKKHSRRVSKKSAESVSADSGEDEMDDFEIEGEVVLDETGKLEDKIGMMEEMLQEIRDGLENQGRELGLLKRDIVDLDSKFSGDAPVESKPSNLEREKTLRGDMDGILGMLGGLLEQSPENISFKFVVSDDYVVYVKVVRKQVDRDRH